MHSNQGLSGNSLILSPYFTALISHPEIPTETEMCYFWFIRLMRRWTKQIRIGKEIRFRFWLQRGQGWQGSKTQAYWLVVRVLLTPPAAAAASQEWKIIYLQVLRALELFREKNRLPRGSNLGQAGGNLCLWGPERFFSIVRNAQYTYPLFARALFFGAG